MKAVGNTLIIEPIIDTHQIAGIEIVQSRQLPQRGKVLAHGPDVITPREKDEVLYAKGAGVPLVMNGKNVIVMRESDIFAVV